MVWFTNLYYKESSCHCIATVLFLGSLPHVIFISMSVIAKSETIQLLFHFQMWDIFFTVISCITSRYLTLAFNVWCR